MASKLTETEPFESSSRASFAYLVFCAGYRGSVSAANAEARDELIEPEKTHLRIMRNNPVRPWFAPRSQIHSLQRFPRSLLTAKPFPQLPNWPTFYTFSVSPFVSAFAMAGQMCTAAAVTGGCFSPSPPGNQEWVNGGPSMSSLRPDASNSRHASSTGSRGRRCPNAPNRAALLIWSLLARCGI